MYVTRHRRRKYVFILLAIALVLGTVASSFGQSQARYGIHGKEAPSLQMDQWYQLPDGRRDLDIGDLRGKVTYLYFFQAWCPGCHKIGFPTLQALQEYYADDPQVAFAAVQTVFEGQSSNTPQRIPEIAAKYELAIPFGHSGLNGRSPIMRDYRTGGTPWVVIIDKDGVVRYNDFHVKPREAAELIERLKASPPRLAQQQ